MDGLLQQWFTELDSSRMLRNVVYPGMQPVTASSLNCLVDNTADPVSEHIPQTFAQNSPLGQYKCVAETVKYHKTRLPKFTDAL